MDETPRGVLSKRPRISSSGNLNLDSSDNSDKSRHASKETLRTASASSSFEKPGRRFINPFEKHALELSDRPVWSPSVVHFPAETPPQASFKWDIEQISRLNPVNFEDSPSTHQITDPLSAEHENEVQSKLRSFFDKHHLPSPAVITASTPIAKKGEKKTVDKCIGTDLSLPLDLPSSIMEMLQKYNAFSRSHEQTDSSVHDDAVDGNMLPPPETGLGFGRYRENLDDTEASSVNGSFFRRKLEFSFECQDEDESMISEEASVIDVGPIHGALILSP